MKMGFRDPSRIEPMLDKLREAWQIYPDMRLGQLITVCAGQSNICGIEDDILLKGIEGYISGLRGSGAFEN